MPRHDRRRNIGTSPPQRDPEIDTVVGNLQTAVFLLTAFVFVLLWRIFNTAFKNAAVELGIECGILFTDLVLVAYLLSFIADLKSRRYDNSPVPFAVPTSMLPVFAYEIRDKGIRLCVIIGIVLLGMFQHPILDVAFLRSFFGGIVTMLIIAAVAIFVLARDLSGKP